MVRGFSLILGVGLTMLWLAGFSQSLAPRWLVWSDFVVAVGAFIVASVASDNVRRRIRAGAPLALSVGLFALWILAISTAVMPWLTWWNFAFGCAFFSVGAVAAAAPEAYGIRSQRRGTYGSYYGLPPWVPMGFDYPFATWGLGWGGNPTFGMGEPQHAGRGPKFYQRPDYRIEEEVNERLTHHWEIDATEVRVSVREGVVTLGGVVDSRRSKRLAEDIVDSVTGVTDVINELSVKREMPRPKAA